MECLDGVDLQHILDNEGKDGLSSSRVVYFAMNLSNPFVVFKSRTPRASCIAT